MKLPKKAELEITSLGPGRFPSPVRRKHFVDEDGGVLLARVREDLKSLADSDGSPPAYAGDHATWVVRSFDAVVDLDTVFAVVTAGPPALMR